MKKSLIRIGLVGMGNVFNALLNFTFLSMIAKTLDIESFGKYALLATLLVAVSKIIDFGTNSVYVADSISKDDETLLDTFYTLKLILLTISIPISIILLLLLKLNSPNIILYFILGLIAYTINYTLNSFFQKDQKFLHLILLNTFPALIKGGFAVLIILDMVVFNLDRSFMVFSLSIFSSAIMWFFLPKEFKKFRFDFSKVKIYLKKSAPAGVSQLIFEGWPSISNSIAKIANSFSHVGIFAIAEKVANILQLGAISIFTILLPKNAYAKKRNEKYDFKEVFVISILILVIAFFGTFISRYFVSDFFDDKFAMSVPLLALLIFSSAFTSIHNFMENYFFIEEKTNSIMYINVGKLVLFLLISLILVPTYSLKGLAISNLISAMAALAATIIFISVDQKLKATEAQE
ncbi:MAG TPA: oligosaccharide flippase family protein [Patescibacteria group bacterium]|nr:oligosaccharide flippase family protein [bacterium]HRY56679.1 oligosaccharide flippase family protein [Patescibacteria group bacterium]